MFAYHTVLLTTDIPSLARANKANLPQKTLMELLLDGFDHVNLLLNADGFHKEVQCWSFLEFDNSDNIIKIQFDHLAFANVLGEERAPVDSTKATVRPGGCIDLHWIPDTVLDFDASAMELAGTIETTYLPRNLRTFQVCTNYFQGTFRIENLPRMLVEVGISNNQLTGSLYLPELPRSLEMLESSNNNFIGTIDLGNLPSVMHALFLAGNSLCGTASMAHRPPALRIIRLHGNEFTKICISNGKKQDTYMYP